MCTVNVEVFGTILDIYLRVEGEDFTNLPDDEIALTFLIDLGYKGPLNRHTNMFIDHMHHPWRTLDAIINKCLYGKTASNDKLKKSRIDILWGMFNRENVDYPELIWEDVAYQIDHRKEKRSRHDGIVSMLKFIRIGEDYQEYGLPIPDVMLTDAIKRLESYQMFIKYPTYHIPPKKSRSKGSKAKKNVEESQETIDVSEESEPEHEPAKKKTSGKRRIKKKVTLSADDNIISDDPDAALELAKSISQNTSSAPKSKPATSKTKLKGAPSLTLQEQEATDIMQALKESKKTSRRKLASSGSNEETCSKPGVLDESIVVSSTLNKGTGAKPGVPDEDKDITEKKEDKNGDADDEGDDHIRVRNKEDVEMKDVEVKESDKCEENVTDAAKEEAEKPSEAKDDTKKSKLHPSSSSLSVSLGFGDRFFKLSFDYSLVSIVKDSADADCYVSTVVDSYLDTKVGDVFQKELQKHTTYLIHKYSLQHLLKLTKKPTPIAKQESEKSPSDILKIKREQAESQKNPQFTINSINKAALQEYDLKSALYQSMHTNKSFNRNPADHRLYHTLIEALIEDENAMNKGVIDTVKDQKRKHDDDEDDDDEDPTARPN
uniref:Uncharacterized protein n=1 Tax=Tanacetum cinerariifolium TaxID=118510 RepID=A0A699JDG1_TANCI|nr:hypothetical protein [Tanacetum cinerariifolium]